MLFCPNCGSILKPGKNKTVLCSCGFSKKAQEKITEKITNTDKAIEIIDKEIETNPLTDAKCDKCGHGKARYWFLQTRSGDEAETRFFKCEKCKHTWREN